MVSIAFEDLDGESWYGTESFKYGEIIATGYLRKGNIYVGYNFVGDEKGVLSLKYDLGSNSFFLGIPKRYLNRFANKRFVASVGYKGFWNDDYR